MKRILGGALVASLLAVGGCSYLGTAIDAAANKTGDVVGQKIGDHVVKTWSPLMMNYYNGYLFGMAFNSGGYEVGETPYTPGQWTKWDAEGRSGGDAAAPATKPNTIERAFLYLDKDKNQVWRVKFVDGESSDTITLEAKFAPDRSKLLRMRAKYPKDAEGQEVPVDDQTYYVPPRKITKESLKGATVGTESVTVPAGTFPKAQHVKFGSPAGVTQEWWLATGVPGGTVQYRESAVKQTSDQPEGAGKDIDPDNYTMRLSSHGAGAVTELGFKD